MTTTLQEEHTTLVSYESTLRVLKIALKIVIEDIYTLTLTLIKLS